MRSYLADRLSWLVVAHRDEVRRYGKGSLAAADTLSEVKTIAAKLICVGCEPLLRVPQALKADSRSMPAPLPVGLGAAPRLTWSDLRALERAAAQARAAWWARQV